LPASPVILAIFCARCEKIVVAERHVARLGFFHGEHVFWNIFLDEGDRRMGHAPVPIPQNQRR
jgi:hypothetical protein